MIYARTTRNATTRKLRSRTVSRIERADRRVRTKKSAIIRDILNNFDRVAAPHTFNPFDSSNDPSSNLPNLPNPSYAPVPANSEQSNLLPSSDWDAKLAKLGLDELMMQECSVCISKLFAKRRRLQRWQGCGHAFHRYKC